MPNLFYLENGFSKETIDFLEQKGYDLVKKKKLGSVQIIGWDSTKEIFTGSSDIRVRKGIGSKGY